MAEIFEKNLHRYLDKLEGLDEGQIIPPDTRFLVPILEKLRYTDDEIVADYYAQILATASMPETAKSVSVTFIEILNRLCADELKILEFINSNKNIITLTNEDGVAYRTNCNGVLPVLNVHIVDQGGGYHVGIKNLSYLLDQLKLEVSSNYNLYLDKMTALGLIIKPAMISFHDNNIYKLLKQNPSINKLEQKISAEQKIDYSEGRIETTDLGKGLLSVGSKRT